MAVLCLAPRKLNPHQPSLLHLERKGISQLKQFCILNILVHQIGISTVFNHMRKFYLKYSVPTSWKGIKNKQRDMYVTFQDIQELLEVFSIFFKGKNGINGEQEKESIIAVRVG